MLRAPSLVNNCIRTIETNVRHRRRTESAWIDTGRVPGAMATLIVFVRWLSSVIHFLLSLIFILSKILDVLRVLGGQEREREREKCRETSRDWEEEVYTRAQDSSRKMQSFSWASLYKILFENKQSLYLFNYFINLKMVIYFVLFFLYIIYSHLSNRQQPVEGMIIWNGKMEKEKQLI